MGKAGFRGSSRPCPQGPCEGSGDASLRRLRLAQRVSGKDEREPGCASKLWFLLSSKCKALRAPRRGPGYVERSFIARLGLPAGFEERESTCGANVSELSGAFLPFSEMQRTQALSLRGPLGLRAGRRPRERPGSCAARESPRWGGGEWWRGAGEARDFPPAAFSGLMSPPNQPRADPESGDSCCTILAVPPKT